MDARFKSMKKGYRESALGDYLENVREEYLGYAPRGEEPPRGKDYQTHVFTCTYTADVSGVCSALYELGGLTILHDPSGCNSTYSTHDEPRWYDTDSLMFVSGLDDTAAIHGDDSVLIRDAVKAAKELSPRFITLCGASIPHILGFDYRGVARLIEKEAHLPVLPVPTDGLRSYVSGVSLALCAFLERFADPGRAKNARENSVNLLGVTPLDFSTNGNVQLLRSTLEEAGFTVNACLAMGDSFETLEGAYEAKCNLVVSSCGRRPAKLMRRLSGLPFVEGLPIGRQESQALIKVLRATLEDGKSRRLWEELGGREGYDWEKEEEAATEGEAAAVAQGEAGEMAKDPLSSPSAASSMEKSAQRRILVIGEEIFARSLCDAISRTREGVCPRALWPDMDEGLAEEKLLRAIDQSELIIADPLYQVVLRGKRKKDFLPFPHEAYSGRIYRKQIPLFAGSLFDLEGFLG